MKSLFLMLLMIPSVAFAFCSAPNRSQDREHNEILQAQYQQCKNQEEYQQQQLQMQRRQLEMQQEQMRMDQQSQPKNGMVRPVTDGKFRSW